MKRTLTKVFLTAALLGSTVVGCQSLPVKKIDPGTLRLPSGSRVLLFEAVRGIVTYDIRVFRRPIDIPGITLVPPPSPTASVFSLDHFVRDAVHAAPVRMALVISPEPSVQRGYSPYEVITGYRERTYRVIGSLFPR
jgi:hypothetical protein